MCLLLADLGVDLSAYCERLGVPLHYDLGPNAWSAAALVHPPDYDRARAAVLYNGPARELVKRFKFYGEIRLSKFLSKCMLNAGAELVAPESFLVPVPLHSRDCVSVLIISRPCW